MRAVVRAVAEADLAEDDGQAEGLFGEIIGGLHARDIEKSEHPVVFAVRIKQAQAELIGVFVSDRPQADGLQAELYPSQNVLDRCRAPGRIPKPA